jgi:hypothetical protein
MKNSEIRTITSDEVSVASGNSASRENSAPSVPDSVSASLSSASPVSCRRVAVPPRTLNQIKLTSVGMIIT